MKRYWIFIVYLTGAFVLRVQGGDINYLRYELEPYYLDYEAESIDEVYQILQFAKRAIGDKDWIEAGRLFDKLYQIDETNPFYIYAIGQIAYWRKDWGEVILFSEQELPAPFTQDAYMMRGGALLNVGRNKEAAECFHKILDVDPSVINARRGLGAAQLSMGMFQDAIETFKLVLVRDSAAIDAKVGLEAALLAYDKSERGISPLSLAQINFSQGDREKGIDILLMEIEKNPLSKELHNRVGVFYEAMGQADLSKKHIEEAVKLTPKDPAVLNNLGVIAMQCHEDEQAFRAFKRAIELDADSPEAYRNLARLHLSRGEWEQSVQIAAQSLEVDNESIPARLMAGYSSYRGGAYKEALAFLEPGILQKTDCASVWFLAGQCAQRLGKNTLAAEYYRAGLALKSDDVLALNNLADLIMNAPDSNPVSLGEALEMAEKASALTSNSIETIELTVDQIHKKKALVEWQLMMSDFK